MTRMGILAFVAAMAMGASASAQPAAGQDGWVSLFDGKSLAGWRSFKTEAPPAGWDVKDGVLARTGKGGDIMTVGQYGSFDLELDYKIAVGGNSGIMYRVVTEGQAPYWSGPEYQILDNERHPDAKNGPDRLAGSNYDLIAPSAAVSKPAGEWNTAKIVVKGNHVEHWLNGTKVVEYEFGSPAWTKMVAEKIGRAHV